MSMTGITAVKGITAGIKKEAVQNSKWPHGRQCHWYKQGFSHMGRCRPNGSVANRVGCLLLFLEWDRNQPAHPRGGATNCWPKAPLGWGGGGGGAWEGRWGGGGLGGFCPGGGGPGGLVGGGGSRWGNLGGTCPQGQALVHHRLPLPPLALPLTIPALNIGTQLVGEGTSSGRFQQQMWYALESG